MTTGKPDAELDFSGWVWFSLEPGTSDGRTRLNLVENAINDDAKSYFGKAYCHWLAGAMHCYTGWKILTVDCCDDGENWWPAHSAILTPKQTALDIFGENSPEELRERYRKPGRVVRTRVVDNEKIPGDVIEGIDDERGNHFWWSEDMDAAFTGIYQHFAQLVLKENGYAQWVNDYRYRREDSLSQVSAQRPTPAELGNPATGWRCMKGERHMSVEDFRHALQDAKRRIEEIATRMNGTITELEEVVSLVTPIVCGTSDSTMTDGMTTLRGLLEELRQSPGIAHTVSETFESYASRL